MIDLSECSKHVTVCIGADVEARLSPDVTTQPTLVGFKFKLSLSSVEINTKILLNDINAWNGMKSIHFTTILVTLLLRLNLAWPKSSTHDP